MSTGEIQVISGCMFAGKTTELLRLVRRERIAKRNVELFTPNTDSRYGTDVIGSHNEKKEKAKVVDPEKGIEEILRIGKQLDTVGIDEANFFTAELVPVVQNLADNNTDVLITGLDQTFRGETFEPMGKLLAVADKVQKLNAICEKCGDTATMTQRLINGEPASIDSPTIKVGGDESYEARCRKCHHLKNEQQIVTNETSHD